jgi:hypothetical protein
MFSAKPSGNFLNPSYNKLRFTGALNQPLNPKIVEIQRRLQQVGVRDLYDELKEDEDTEGLDILKKLGVPQPPKKKFEAS